jgi:hypothetical protein
MDARLAGQSQRIRDHNDLSKVMTSATAGEFVGDDETDSGRYTAGQTLHWKCVS